MFSVLVVCLLSVCQAAVVNRIDEGQTITRIQAEKLVHSYQSTLKAGEKLQWDCELCKLGTTFLQQLAEEKATWNDIQDALIFLCIKLELQDEIVCGDIVREFKDEVLTVMDTLYLKPEEICSQLFGSTCGPGYDPTKMWFIKLPATPKPPIKPVPLPKPGSPTLKVLHLSDIHVDLKYREGYDAKCGEPICCRKPSKHVEKPAGRWGMYEECDLPPRTLENMFHHLSTNHTFDYILWTGDLPAHYVWLSSKNDTAYLLHYITDMLLKYFPHTPVHSTLGNHEGVPVNSFPPNWPQVPEQDSARWLYGNASETWTPWLPNSTRSTILKGGFYTSLIYPGLRMISLNMNFCNNQNWWLLLNMTDPEGQLQWLVEVLQHAEDHGEKVQIIGHIPPGTTSCVKAWSWNYYTIINRYESTIVGQFYGHSHKDHWEIFYDPASNFTRATSMAYIGPGAVAASSGNSGYKVYTLDGNYKGTTWSVLDEEVYIFNLTEANLPNHEPVWFKEYSAKKAFNLTSLQPAEWDKLVTRMENDDKLFQLFLKYYFKSYVRDPCDKACKQTMLCALRSARSYDDNLCRNYTSVFNDFPAHLRYLRQNDSC